MDGTANYYPAKNTPDCRILCIQSQNFSWIQTPISSRLPHVAVVLFLLYETTTVYDTLCAQRYCSFFSCVFLLLVAVFAFTNV